MNPTDPARLRRASTLVVRSGRMGDFLMAVPALAALRRRRPEDRIVLLTGISQDRRTAALARRYSGAGLPPWVQWFEGRLFDEVIGFGRWNDPTEWRALRARLGVHRFRDAFVLPYFSESRLRRWQKHLWLRSLGHWGKIHSRYNESAAARPPALSLQTCAALDVVARGLGLLAVEPIQPALATGAAAEAFAAEFWRQPGVAERPVVAMFPAGNVCAQALAGGAVRAGGRQDTGGGCGRGFCRQRGGPGDRARNHRRSSGRARRLRFDGPDHAGRVGRGAGSLRRLCRQRRRPRAFCGRGGRTLRVDHERRPLRRHVGSFGCGPCRGPARHAVLRLPVGIRLFRVDPRVRGRHRRGGGLAGLRAAARASRAGGRSESGRMRTRSPVPGSARAAIFRRRPRVAFASPGRRCSRG